MTLIKRIIKDPEFWLLLTASALIAVSSLSLGYIITMELGA